MRWALDAPGGEGEGDEQGQSNAAHPWGKLPLSLSKTQNIDNSHNRKRSGQRQGQEAHLDMTWNYSKQKRRVRPTMKKNASSLQRWSEGEARRTSARSPTASVGGTKQRRSLFLSRLHQGERHAAHLPPLLLSHGSDFCPLRLSGALPPLERQGVPTWGLLPCPSLLGLHPLLRLCPLANIHWMIYFRLWVLRQWFWAPCVSTHPPLCPSTAE